MLQSVMPSMLEFMIIDVVMWTARAACAGFFGSLAWHLGKRLAEIGKREK